jgi:hypothetical protein
VCACPLDTSTLSSNNHKQNTNPPTSLPPFKAA